MATLQLRGLHKRFAATVAVERFDLDVGDGELVALLGPSGCGKSTVMRGIAGITPFDGGEVRIAGRDVGALPPERRDVGLVFQSYALFPHMTVAANVGFGLRMRRKPRAEIQRRVADALAMVALDGLERRYPRELSGGQQQRVALARALVVEPDVLLLDEPLSNLDAKLREHLRDDIRALQRRVGTTTLYVTHDQSEALALADRIVVMDRGRVVETGTAVDLYRTPRSRFTAEFLGHANLLEGRAEPSGVALPWGQRLPPRPGLRGRLTLLVRPEDVAIDADPEGPGRIEEAVFQGAAIAYRIAVGSLVIRAQVTGSAGAVLPRGTRVEIRIPPDCHAITGGPIAASTLAEVA
jgi:putative spermidine/putrescine transport system ATP-binding protein